MDTIKIPVLPEGATPIGLGDVVKKATDALRIKPCSPCAKRREALNRALSLTPKQGGG